MEHSFVYPNCFREEILGLYKNCKSGFQTLSELLVVSDTDDQTVSADLDQSRVIMGFVLFSDTLYLT